MLYVFRFEKMFVGVGPAIAAAFAVGIQFSAVDGTFFKHILFGNGVALLLTTRDGNNELLLLAWVICLGESAENYRYFAEMCRAVGLGRYLNKKGHLIYSDRAKGIPAFLSLFKKSHNAACFRHVIKNCQRYLRKTTGARHFFRLKDAWAMQTALTLEEYETARDHLKTYNWHAAHYFNELPHEQVYQYAMLKLGIATHGHKTSNAVESVNGVLVEYRHQSPLWFNDQLLKWIGQKIADRVTKITKWIEKGHFLTPYAYNKWKLQVQCLHPAHCAQCV